MRIHLISNLYSPDELAGASLFTDLAYYLRDAGHDVRVTTTFSYYPSWRLRDEDRDVPMREEIVGGIPVRRVAMYVPAKPTGLGRMRSDLSFFWALLRAGKFPDWRPDVIVTALPMLSQCLVQRFQHILRRIPRLIIVQDFAVDAALELGILRLPGVAWILRGIQRWALRSASTITTISPLMLTKLQKEIGTGRRTLMVPNWIHKSLQDESNSQNQSPPARLPSTLFYSGNLGVKQGLPDFLGQFADSSGVDSGWNIEICGGGAEKDRLKAMLDSQRGIALGPVLDEPSYVSKLLSSTACLITQRPGIGANFLPSKLLPALATATPVLAVCDRSSPLANEVIEGRFGLVVAPGNPEALAESLEMLRSPTLREEFSVNAKARAAIYHRERVLRTFDEELRNLSRVKTA
jgi:colanic acid biosynthesis glycosyl transferase WcaI